MPATYSPDSLPGVLSYLQSVATTKLADATTICVQLGALDGPGAASGYEIRICPQRHVHVVLDEILTQGFSTVVAVVAHAVALGLDRTGWRVDESALLALGDAIMSAAYDCLTALDDELDVDELQLGLAQHMAVQWGLAFARNPESLTTGPSSHAEDVN